MLDKIKGFKTFIHVTWISAIGAAMACWDQLPALGIDPKSVIGEFVPVKYVGLIVIGIAFLFGYMRLISNTPPFKSE